MNTKENYRRSLTIIEEVMPKNVTFIGQLAICTSTRAEVKSTLMRS